MEKQIVINLKEEKRIEEEAEALAQLWFEQSINPDPASREVFRFMPPLHVPVVIYKRAKELLEIKLNNLKK